MRIFLFIIYLVTSLYGSAPAFISCEMLSENNQGQVYITIDHGICLDDYGNGMIYDCVNDNNYISYSGIKKVKTGDEVYTFCIINPETNESDDIIGRIDVITDTEEVFIDVDGVQDYAVTEYGIQLYFDDGTGYWCEW